MASPPALSSMIDMGKEFECSICLEIWSDPKTLPCSHIFCKDCLSPLIFGSSRQMISCPTCRTDHVIPDVGLSNAWSTQRILTNLADSMRSLESVGSFEYSSSTGQSFSSVRADPRQSYVEVKETKRKLGSVFVMVVKLRDSSGQTVNPALVSDQINASVDLQPPSSHFTLEVMSPKILNEACCFMYQPKKCGVHVFTVRLGVDPIKDMPLKITVQPRGFIGCEIKGPLKGPRDVSCCGDNFLVTDGIAKTVFLIDHTGRELKTLKLQRDLREEFCPMAIATYQGKAYVTDMGNRCVHRYDELDGFPTQFGDSHLQKPTGIVVSPDNGSIFVVDNARKNVTIFDQDGNFTKVIDYLSHKRVDSFNNPQMVAINGNGDRLFVADQDDEGNSSIKIINVFEGKLEKKIPVKFSTNQAKPSGVAIGKNDLLYVTAQVVPPDTEGPGTYQGHKKSPKGRGAGGGDQKKSQRPCPNGVVMVYDSTGYFLGVFATILHHLDRPGGLVVSEDTDGSPLIYVVDSPGRQRNGALKAFII